jgi:hypothetical protein
VPFTIHPGVLFFSISDSLPGPPLSNDTALVTLTKNSVAVGLGVREAWEARNTRFDIQWVRNLNLFHLLVGLAHEFNRRSLNRMSGSIRNRHMR